MLVAIIFAFIILVAVLLCEAKIAQDAVRHYREANEREYGLRDDD